jgi:hypothetical protein
MLAKPSLTAIQESLKQIIWVIQTGELDVVIQKKKSRKTYL